MRKQIPQPHSRDFKLAGLQGCGREGRDIGMSRNTRKGTECPQNTGANKKRSSKVSRQTRIRGRMSGMGVLAASSRGNSWKDARISPSVSSGLSTYILCQVGAPGKWDRNVSVLISKRPRKSSGSKMFLSRSNTWQMTRGAKCRSDGSSTSMQMVWYLWSGGNGGGHNRQREPSRMGKEGEGDQQPKTTIQRAREETHATLLTKQASWSSIQHAFGPCWDPATREHTDHWSQYHRQREYLSLGKYALATGTFEIGGNSEVFEPRVHDGWGQTPDYRTQRGWRNEKHINPLFPSHIPHTVALIRT